MFLLQLIFVTSLLLAIPSLCYLLGRRFASCFFRRAAYEIHLWLGIASALILFVVCLSGTLLTFKTETIMFLEKERYYVNVPPSEQRKSLEELVPIIEHAEDGKVVRVTIPEGADRSWIFNVRKNATTKGRSKMPAGMPAMHAMLGSAYLVDPYTGQSLGPQRSGTYMFFMMLQFLHRFLLLPIRTGQLVVGTATLIFVVLIVGGLFLWLPGKLRSKKAWMFGLKVRTKKGWSRFLYDTHNTLGFYSLIPLMIMALTGPVISFSWYREAAGKFLGTRPFAKSFEKPVLSSWDGTEKRTKSWDEFLAQADEAINRHGVAQIYLPQSPKDNVTVRKTGAGFCTIAATDKIQYDQYSAQVLKADFFDEMTFGEQVSTLIFPLHNGEIFGTVSKMVYFITCLIATTLPLTGLILWINKLRARHKANMRKKSIASQTQSIVSKKGDIDSHEKTLDTNLPHTANKP